MTALTLISRSLRFYWRTHLGVVLGAAAATAVLLGALLVGDSVRGSLRQTALARLGGTQLAISASGRFFREALADELAAELRATVAPVLAVRGIARPPDDEARAAAVRVLGVDERFWEIGGLKRPPDLAAGQAAVGEPLAASLALRPTGNGRIVLAIPKPSPLSRDAPMATDETDVLRVALECRQIVKREQFGHFDLQANQVPPRNVFVPLSWLQQQLGLKGRANMLLVGGAPGRSIGLAEAGAAVKRCWTPADAEVELTVGAKESAEPFGKLTSRRVFLDPPIAEAVVKADVPALGILTYLVNRIDGAEDKSTPYSFVSAIGPLRGSEPAAGDPVWHIIPPEMSDGEIIISDWLAGDLNAKPGDIVKLTHYVLTPRGALAVAPPRPFRVRSIRPMDAGPAAECMKNLMPTIPGLSDKTSCTDWKLGTRVNAGDIRIGLDDRYWLKHRGTPKAFVTLAAGRNMWANRFGNLTAIHFPADSADAVAAAIRQHVDPAAVGLAFQPVRQQALAASAEGTDFGRLFAGLSIFLVVSGVLLMGLLFVFGIQQRNAQAGLLLAVGFSPGRLRRLLLAEGSALALIGAAIGAAAGVAYTKAMLAGLATVWRPAAAGAPIHFHAAPATVAAGVGAGALVAVAAMWLALLRQARRPARELLGSPAPQPAVKAAAAGRKLSLGFAVLAFATALVLLLSSRGSADAASPFFGAGALLLAGAIALTYAMLLPRRGQSPDAPLTLARLGLRNARRRRWRSLATVGLLACGSFVVVAVGAFRQDPLAGADRPSSGTGGFALYGESSAGVLQNLNSAGGRKALGLAENDLSCVRVVPLRVRDGDDASCLNLNRATTPRILGVRPEELHRRGAFTFVKTLGDALTPPWMLLERKADDGATPAVADQTTITWALGKSLGDTLELRDEAGRTFKLRLIGALKNSILQGSIIIAESRFVEHFPGEEGHRAFLIDAPTGRAGPVAAALLSQTSALRKLGLELTPATERLAAFTAVENTYLSIFQLLGGLGLLLGSVALGIVVLRNVLERRSELAILRAVGFSNRRLLAMLLCEHWLLLVAGLACGTAAGIVAVLPALASAGAEIPALSLGLTLTGVLLSGAVWVYLAAALAVRGRLLPALRSE